MAAGKTLHTGWVCLHLCPICRFHEDYIASFAPDAWYWRIILRNNFMCWDLGVLEHVKHMLCRRTWYALAGLYLLDPTTTYTLLGLRLYFFTWHYAQELFAKRCFSLIDEYAPGFSSSVLGYDMLTPPDLERVIGLTGACTWFLRSSSLALLLILCCPINNILE